MSACSGVTSLGMPPTNGANAMSEFINGQPYKVRSMGLDDSGRCLSAIQTEASLWRQRRRTFVEAAWSCLCQGYTHLTADRDRGACGTIVAIPEYRAR
jgi:hypothetical protein